MLYCTSMEPIIALFVFLIGLGVGSFLNASVFRIRSGESVMKGRSKCLTCEEPIAWYDLIPIVSYFLLRGRCRKCNATFSIQYPLVEFAVGALFFLFYLRYATGFALPAQATTDTLIAFFLRDLLFTTFLVLIFVYDLKYSLILDRFTIPAMIVALLVNVLLGFSPVSLLLGGALLAGFFFLQYSISDGEWVGGGDMRMGAVMGFMLGIQHGLVALFIAYLLGAAVGLILLGTKKATMKTRIPFGTFLVIGTLVMMFVGDPLIGWYLSLFS